MSNVRRASVRPACRRRSDLETYWSIVWVLSKGDEKRAWVLHQGLRDAGVAPRYARFPGWVSGRRPWLGVDRVAFGERGRA